MLETVLHTGSEHPDLLWILVPSFASLLAGIGIGAYSDRVREWITPRSAPAEE
ncbi:hypothetical protein [Halopiger goleimassiliensis]|uniref:hypothetical protein n=1 Tax=Halopiger goleimassiliensis TaxID=1293048 RepID=UPI0018A850E6|nr:hypothetical protein [Halopiger goleimassiliensis]